MPIGNNSVIAGGGFHHVAVKVHDFAKSVRFYEALGFKKKAAWKQGDDDACMLDTGDGNYVEVFGGGPAGDKHPWGQGAALIHIAIRTRDVPAALALAEKNGATVTMKPTETTITSIDGRPVKIHIAFCQAPGGEVIEFFDNDPTQL